MVKKIKDMIYYESVGRRKESVARVRLYIVAEKGGSVPVKSKKISAGEIFLNDKKIEESYILKNEQVQYEAPLKMVDSLDRFAVSIKVSGGGKNGQLGAIIHGLARSLCLVDPENYKKTLREAGYLTRDPRTRERRMVGMGGKSRRSRQSPKR